MKLTSRFLFIALFSIGLAPMLQGQNLYPYRKDSLWGYCDSSKHIVIPIQYNSASIFSYCGIATVKINGKYRFIDKSGKYINDIEYDGWSFFWANKTYVWLDDKYGLIDSAGNEVIPAIYDDVNYTTDILAFKKEDNWALFDYNSGKRTTGFKYQDIVIRSYKLKGVKIKDKWGFVNRKGRLKIKPKFDEIDGFSKEGLCAVRQGKKWGFVNLKGKVVGKFDYSQVYSYQTEGAWVKKDSKWGLIDTKGEVVIPFLYSDVSYFKEGLAYVKQDDKFGFIDGKGTVVIPFNYPRAFEFSEGLASVCLGSATCGYINKKGEMVIPFEFSTNYGCEFSEGIAEVKKGDLYGFIDSTGKVIVPVKYKTSYDYNGFDNGVGMLIDSETDKRFYFDKAGTLFFED